MDWLYALLGILVVIAVAFLLGRMKYEKNPVAYTFVWIGSILALFVAAGWGSRLLLLLLLVLDGLGHIPVWVIYTVVSFGAVLLLRHVLILMTQSITDLAYEQEQTNARIARMENSLRDKLDDISSRLPERDEAEG